MKNALKIVLFSIPVALLGYSKTALVPAVDMKSLLIRALVMIALVLVSILFFTDKNFQAETTDKLRIFWKNPLGKFFAASFVILILSTLFAFDKFTAFFGTAARGEGFIGLSFFYFLTLLLSLVFEKKDWLTFWKVTIFSGAYVFLRELFAWFGGAYRPGSLMDNPIFLAGYFLVVIYAGIIVWGNGKETKNISLQWLGGSAIVFSVIGIFITQSRGVLVGLVAGIFVSLLYLAFKKSDSGRKNTAIRNATIAILAFGILFGGLFIATRHANVWTHIPGFSRLAEFSFSDPTTLSRLENARLTLRAVRPTPSNIKNTLIGWGWDNYVFAWQANYDPALYQFDRAIFDRAHNKLLDVLVMNGILGLLAYLAIWFYVIRSVFRIGKQSVVEAVALLFFATGFFIQNLFVFDTIISYVPFFSVIAYVLFQNRESAKNHEQK